jgi:two-component system OmpR family response regulator
MNILLVEDEPAVAAMAARGLSTAGHRVTVVASGEEGIRRVEGGEVDLVLLDLGLPRCDGQHALTQIRRTRSHLPVIMLSARDDLGSKVAALEAGADDFVAKPFVFAELLARIRAIGRRRGRSRPTTIARGDLRIDLGAHRVWRGDQEIVLSRREFALLDYFARHQDRLLSRQQILSAVWEHDFDGESNLVDVYVRYLRAKLDRTGESSVITTVRGAGYRFASWPAA